MKEYCEDGNIVYEGEFKNFKRDGPGIEFDKKTGAKIYEG